MEATGNVQPAKRSSGTKWLFLGCGVVVLLLVCCVVIGAVAYVSGAAQPVLALLGLGGKAQAAALAPADAPMFMAVDIDLGQAANFKKLWSIYEKQDSTQKGLDDWKKQFHDSSGCDFDADIAPWWGPDAAVFLTDASNLSAPNASSKLGSSSQPTANAVIAIGTRDQAKAAAALQKCNKTPAESEETYKNTRISIYKSGAAAVVRNYLLIGTTTDALHAAIDTYTGGGAANLAQSAKFKSVIARLPAGRVATVYVDPQPLISAYESQPGISPQMLDQVQMYQGVGASLAFVENGLRMDVAMAFDPAKVPACTRELYQTANPSRILQAIPANSYFMLSGTNLKGAWDCTLSQMDDATKKQMQEFVDGMREQTGVDLVADLLSWMTGEFGLAVTPSKPLTTGLPSMGALVLVEAKDQALVNSKMDKLKDIFALAGLAFKDQTIKGNKMKVGTMGTGPSATTLGYGFLGDWFVLGGPSDALNSAADASGNPIAGDETFKKVRALLPAKNTGYYYVSVSGIDKLVSSMLKGKDLTSYQQEVQPWLKPIKAIGLAAETGKSDVVAATVFAYIQGD